MDFGAEKSLETACFAKDLRRPLRLWDSEDSIRCILIFYIILILSLFTAERAINGSEV